METSVTPFESLATPALLVERDRLANNTHTMGERMNTMGVSLRPHVKTAKSARIAELAVEGHFGGITVSTLREAEYFHQAGFSDLLYAVGITADKFQRAKALCEQGARLTVVTDAAEVAESMARAAGTLEGIRAMIEVDTGGRRAGVLPESDTLLDLGRMLHDTPGLEFLGVMTHAGHSYHCRDVESVRAVAEEERAGIVRAAERLREAGIPCPVVSAGSTPTAVHAESLEGITEMRPGVYVFYDLDQLAIGACSREDLALSVLATVIGHNRHASHLLLDAGALALSKDRSATEFRPEVGYGEVCDPTTLQPYENLFVAGVHQEHGIVPVPEPFWFERLPVGTRVRILPNHACITAAGYERYVAVENGRIKETWDRVNGW